MKPDKSKYKIVWMKPSDIIPWEGNPKLHNQEGINESVNQRGIQNHITIQKSSKKIITGHGRLAAFLAAEYDEVPVREWDCSDEEAIAFALDDNQLVMEPGWDDSKLYDAIKDLKDSDSLDLLLGFDEDDINALIETFDPTEIEEDSVPDIPAQPKSKRGQVYQLGNHRLMCGDSCSEDDVKLLMNGLQGDMVFTDPPYGVSYTGQSRDWEMIEGDEDLEAIRNALPVLLRYVVPTATLYICSASKFCHNVQQIFDDNDVYFSVPIIWNKGRAGVSWYRYHPHYELIYHAGAGAKPTGSQSVWYGPNNETTDWDIGRDTGTYVHPTQKPVALSARAIKNSSKKGALVLDIFGGSGSTLLAAEQLERTCHMMEIDPRYVDVIILRWENYTGKKAVLLEEGAPALAGQQQEDVIELKALTIKEPWASKILRGEKTIETRSRPTKHRGPLVLHCAQTPKSNLSGNLFAVVDLHTSRKMKKADEKAACCKVYNGANSWALKNLRPITPLIKAKGQQGFFKVTIPRRYLDSNPSPDPSPDQVVP